MGKLRNILKVTALTAWLATQPVSVDAQHVEFTKNKTNRNLVEVVTQSDLSLWEDTKDISFTYAKLLQDQQFFEEFLNNKELYELLDKYWEKGGKQLINEIITNENTEKILVKILKDKEIQKALEEWNNEEARKKVEEKVKTIYNTYDIHNTKHNWKEVIVVVLWLIVCFIWSEHSIKYWWNKQKNRRIDR